MAAQTKVELQGAPDVANADNLYQGFVKINANIDLLAGAPSAAGSGASAIGYYPSGGPATNLQAYLDTFSYDGTNGVTDGANVTYSGGSTFGYIYRDKTTNEINFKAVVAGTNITIDNNTDTIVINSGLTNSNNVTVLDSTNNNYDIASDDEIILIDTEDTAFTINLPAGSDKRIVNIKNLAWTGTGASPVANTTEVTIVADTTAPDYVEDDRTGLPSVSTAIGPGSAMRLVFDAGSDVWSII